MEENSDNCVDKEPYRILYSTISPVCPRGRKRVSIWKGADCISDFYNVQKASESQTQIDFSMMFDDDALYAVVSCGTPDAYAPVAAGVPSHSFAENTEVASLFRGVYVYLDSHQEEIP